MKKQKKIFSSEKVMPRFNLLMWVFFGLGILILIKAAYVMFVERDYWMTVSRIYVSNSKPLPATRGNILAADGQVLATSLPEYLICLDPFSGEQDSLRKAKDQRWRDSMLVANVDTIARGLKRIIPEVDVAATKQRILDGRFKKKSHRILLHRSRISYIQLAEVKKLPLLNLGRNIGGFYTEDFRRRKNPYGRLAARTIGNLRRENDSALSGLELAYDSVLSGRPGSYHRKKLAGKTINMIDTLAVDGSDVVTTLDIGFQDYMEKVLGQQLEHLGATAGMCILMEVATGDIKAMSSLSRLAGGGYAEIDPRAVTNMMEPGSVFKPMSLMVALDDGKITMASTVNTGNGVREMHGRKMRDSNWRKGGDGILAVPDIIKKSSNVGVSVLIDNAYANNPDAFVDGLQRIGVMEDLHIPIPGYKVPRIRHKRDNPDRWYGTTLPWMSIGYETQVPPISTLTFYNGVANGGRLVRPRFVTAIKRGDEVEQEFPVVVLREQMCKPETLRGIQQCLEGVVGKNSGTGKLAYSKYFPVAGKTGTAQIWSKGGFSSNYLVSFAGYFPANAPKYSMIVCIEKTAPAYGGLHCCPVFKSIAEYVMSRELNTSYKAAIDSTEHRGLLPLMQGGNIAQLNTVLTAFKLPYNEPAMTPGLAWGYNAGGQRAIDIRIDAQQDGIPNVVGYGLRDAVYRLERMGVKVKFTGMGRVVKQSLKPGTALRPGMLMQLILSTDAKFDPKDLDFAMMGNDSAKKDSGKVTPKSPPAVSNPPAKSETPKPTPEPTKPSKPAAATASTQTKPSNKPKPAADTSKKKN